jgi:ferritin-like metal-binding protein YciE
MGKSTSSLKDAARFVTGKTSWRSAIRWPANTFANNALEHFEFAPYKSLLILCEPAGANSARALLPCRTVLRDMSGHPNHHLKGASSVH